MKDRIETLYLDWFNNFLTVERFAEYYGMSVDKAHKVIRIGRYLNHRRDNMKTIQLEMSDKAFKATIHALHVKVLVCEMKPLDYAWLKVIEHIKKGETVVTLKNRADQGREDYA